MGREDISRATDAIRVLEIQLREERCVLRAESPSENIDLAWERVNGRLRVTAEWEGQRKALLELPAEARVAAYPHLAALAGAARGRMRQALDAAGLLDDVDR